MPQSILTTYPPIHQPTQRMEHKGIKFWCYNAGHVLGAAMFMVEIAGVRLLYTGDYSMEDDRCVLCVCVHYRLTDQGRHSSQPGT